MSKLIFVNLPVSDLARATAFYEAVGAEKNEHFCDHTASCMVFSETIHAMLLTHDKFRQFTPEAIADATKTSEVLICLSADSRAAVDEMVGKAGAAGGVADPAPKQDYGFMYGRSFEDPDGHIWEAMWMDVAAAEAAMTPRGTGRCLSARKPEDADLGFEPRPRAVTAPDDADGGQKHERQLPGRVPAIQGGSQPAARSGNCAAPRHGEGGGGAARASARRDHPGGLPLPRGAARRLARRRAALRAVRAGKNSLAIYSFMFPRSPQDGRPGPSAGSASRLTLEESPCPSCTALLDQLDGAAEHVAQRLNFVVAAKTPLPRLLAFAEERGWRRLRLLSSANNSYNRDYFGETADGIQQPMLNVFHRDDSGVRHFWGAELLYAPTDPGQDPRHVGTLEPLWNLFDLTPEGRGAAGMSS